MATAAGATSNPAKSAVKENRRDRHHHHHHPPKNKKPWHVLLGGFVAGAVSRTVTAPLDRVKVLSQEGRIVAWDAATRHPTVHAIADVKKRQMRLSKVVKHIYEEGGVTAFWRGNGINCLKAGPELGLVFFLRERFMGLLDFPDASIVGNFVCSASAGATAQCLLYPLETTKTRMAVASSGEYAGVADCIRQSYSRGGVKDFYKGLGANLLGIVPYRGLEVGCFYCVRAWLMDYRHRRALTCPTPSTAAEEAACLFATLRSAPLPGPDEDGNGPGCGDDEPVAAPSSVDVACVGAASSVFAQTVTYPLNLVRTRLQTQGVNGRPTLYHGMVHCATSIVKADGLSGLFAGLTANYLKAVPASVVTFVVVEWIQQALQSAPLLKPK